MKLYFAIKRLFDIFSSILLLLIISPLLLIIIICQIISLRSFKVFFLDKRVGLNNKEFNLIKFRSMFVDSETNISKYLSSNQIDDWNKERKVTDDPRVTRFGSFLRKTSLDELPQLFNIIGGQMSVVGPRPITKTEVESNFTLEEQKVLLSTRPGLIGTWGVNGRNEISYSDGRRQKIELEYFNKRGLFQDLKLIFKAIPAVISGRGAR